MFAFLSLFSGCLCEIFEFKNPGDTVQLRFKLDANNINTGFFFPEPSSNLTYSVNVESKDGKKILYRMEKLEVEKQTHFSFNNTEVQDAVLTITAMKVDDAAEHTTGSCRMKFESAIDTFNKEISKKAQIEPAIYTLEQLLKRENELIKNTQHVSERAFKLGKSNRNTTWITLMYNIVTPIFYLILCFWQLQLLRRHLQRKKL